MPATEISNATVVLMGMGVVFVGLICIVILCSVLGWLCRKFEKKPEQKPQAAQPQQPAEIPNRQEWIAAVSAAVAEELGTDVSAIRILSVKRV